MTSTEHVPLTCPNCSSTATAIGGSGSAICTDCAHMWNPADDPAANAVDLAPFGMAPVEEVFGLPPTVDDTVEFFDPSELIGGVATLEGGQTAEVVSFTVADTIIVRLSTGDLTEVPMGDVERIMPPVVIPEPVVIPDDVNAMPPDMQLTIELARVILRAGCESVTGTGANVTPGVPPVGYLPDDPDLLQVIERAAGLAVAMLIDAFELDVDQILVFVGAVDESSEVATETTEENNESATTVE